MCDYVTNCTFAMRFKPENITVNTKPQHTDIVKTDIFKIHSKILKDLNEVLMAGFLSHFEDPDIKRTHLFNGRYENIYLDESHIPKLKTLLDEACAQASAILKQENLRARCWFNHMPPGAVTLPHSHDDDDELLSAAYYVEVPENSGNLMIHSKDEETITITPRAGMLVLFKPDVVHEVSENKSQQDRLSIGINFGIPQNDQENA